jgi:probable DNA repair protein
MHVAENQDAELRTAGAWARQQLERNPQQRVAIVITRLERDADRSLRLIKEGLIPGWQNAGASENNIVNISYGRKLIDYPAISMAVLALRWLHSDLSTTELSPLLLTSLLDSTGSDALARIELRLRQRPDQSWSPRALLAEASSRHGGTAADAVLARIRHIAELRDRLPNRQSPSAWAALFDDILNRVRWPGLDPLDSSEFQLLNRWRELLNEVARLELVSPSMTAVEALGRVVAIAGETVYQAESDEAVVQVMGPLEAAGLQFDALWIAGVSDRNWPPSSRPLTLVSRELQRSHGMPDASPADTLDFSTRVLQRLLASAPQLTVSFSISEEDVQQSASELLGDLGANAAPGVLDPAWHARTHAACGIRLVSAADPVPPVTATEIVAGGAATIQRQFEEPISAFAIGRLGVRLLWPITAGLPPNVRGSLIHAALHRLYATCPTRADIRDWISSDLDARLEQAIRTAFYALETNADAVLRRLLQLEKQRVTNLLRGVIAVDAKRDAFRVQAVEQKLEASVAGIRLRLRLDRIDLDEAGGALILDYKTGAPKKLLDREKNPRDLQLLVYASAVRGPVAGIGLFNIDSRAIELDTAGRATLPDENWDTVLAEWQRQVTLSAQQMAAGDVRVNRWRTSRTAKALALLSRYQELLREP